MADGQSGERFDVADGIANQPETFRFEARAGVVEDRAGDEAGAQGREHLDDQRAAGGAEKDRPLDPEMIEAGGDVARFGRDAVGVRAVRIAGAAAAAIVEGDDRSRMRALADRFGQRMEVAGVAGQTRQADHRQPRLVQ